MGKLLIWSSFTVDIIVASSLHLLTAEKKPIYKFLYEHIFIYMNYCTNYTSLK